MKTNTGAARLTALGDSTRRGIFEALTRKPKSVGELAAALPVTRPAVSQHLRILLDAGLVTVRHDGSRRVYAANPSGIALLRASIERYWRDALVAYKTATEREED